MECTNHVYLLIPGNTMFFFKLPIINSQGTGRNTLQAKYGINTSTITLKAI